MIRTNVKWCPVLTKWWKEASNNKTISGAIIRTSNKQVFLPPFVTHLPQVPHICVSELGQRWFRQWLIACSAPSHYLNQCWPVVNWTHRNKFQWNSNRNTKLSIQKKMHLKIPGGDEYIHMCCYVSNSYKTDPKCYTHDSVLSSTANSNSFSLMDLFIYMAA